MKEEDSQPLVPVTDEVMEARIVAWVLGEASAFEIAELERLCAEQPELELFRRRMLALQGLLEEAITPDVDAAAWKLPSAKRAVVEETFGIAEAARPEPAAAKRKKPAWQWMGAGAGIAASVSFAWVAWRSSMPQGGDLFVGESPAVTVSYAEQGERMPSAAERADLARMIRAQEDKVEERRRALSNIVREKEIIYRGKDSILGNGDDASGSVADAQAKLGQQRIELKSQIESLLKYDSEQLMTYASGLDLPENIVKELYPHYLEARRELDAVKSQGAAPSDPKVAELEAKAQGMKKDLDSGVVNLRDVLRAKMEMADAQLAQIENLRTERKAEAVRTGIDTQDYAAAKRDFEEDLAKLQMMKKQAAENNFMPSEKTAMASAPASPKARPRVTPPDADGFALAGSKSKMEPPAPPASPAPAADTRRRGDLPQSRFTAVGSDGADADPVRHSLYIAEGNYNLGKYDDAKREYENVLRTDPSNAAARRGLERLASEKSDYYRAAYDYTRAELLMEVDKAWELSVPGQPTNPLLPELQKPAEAPLDSLAAVADAPAASADAEGQGIGTGLGFGMEDTTGRMPAIEEIDLSEISAAEEAFSTFSLNVSDVSFQLAKAELDRGGIPAPDSIKVEQFYNAVDYRDPSPENGEPVAGVVEQSGHPVIPGRNLVRLGVRTASAGRAMSQPLRLTLLIDQSGSMVREDRREAMGKAIEDLSKLLTAADRVTVIGFSRTPRMLLESHPGDRLGELAVLINPEASEGGTNLEEAMKLAHELSFRHRLEGAQNRIVLFTDGAANLGDADPVRLSQVVTAMRNGGVAFDVAGIGAEDLNDRLLADLARHGNGRYYIATDNLAAQLAGAFRPAAEDVKVQVKFNPDRVSRYKLVGFEESRLKTEDFRNDAVDAAELAAEEAAVALYQVELIPGGKGGIGEMSVRFRDAASGDTVELSWSIPFDEAAPAFDRATPSMQLAGLSMLAAEKLKGGPLGQAIDFRNFKPSIARVKNHYAGSGSVPEMLRVIGILSR